MAALVKWKCTMCDHTSEQYAYVTSMYHNQCPRRKRGTLAAAMVPVVAVKS